MALIRDTKYVKTLSKLTNSGDVMDDACRMILSDAELKLRVLICVSLWRSLPLTSAYPSID